MDCMERIVRISNAYYNQGLERAKVRDLSGAAESLRKSLKFYKMNMDARNLLGLVYFEMGETVDAISQWVISKSLNPENNIADEYLKAVQNNGNKLDSINQTIKKYNQALLYCRNGSRDLALIQLKKVLALNPRLVKGHQLLALLYMESGRYDLAKRSLRDAGRIDANNTTTLRYLREVNRQLHGDHPPKKNNPKQDSEELMVYQSGNDTIIRPQSFKDNSAILTIVNMVIGIAIGVLISWFLIVPSVKEQAITDANQIVKDANATIADRNQTIGNLEKQIEELEKRLQENKTDADIQDEEMDEYLELIKEYETQLLPIWYQQGDEAYRTQNFEDAAKAFQKIVDIDETFMEWHSTYFLADCYRNLEETELAIQYFQTIIEKASDSPLAPTAQVYLDELETEPTE